MVDSERDAITGGRRIVLRPNVSLTRRQVGLFLAVVGLVMAAIAGGFAILGLWGILPFSGAEWLLLAYCFKLSFQGSLVCEVITITEAWVIVEKGRERPEATYRFQRAWVSLDWTQPQIAGHPSRLSFRSHGKQVEVGRFLVESERATLARELRQILHSTD